jgi:hypothetical protein
MCLAISGGGALPPVYGMVAEAIGSKSVAFIVPLVCYAFVGWFGIAARKAPVHAIEEGVTAGHQRLRPARPMLAKQRAGLRPDPWPSSQPGHWLAREV